MSSLVAIDVVVYKINELEPTSLCMSECLSITITV